MRPNDTRSMSMIVTAEFTDGFKKMVEGMEGRFKKAIGGSDRYREVMEEAAIELSSFVDTGTTGSVMGGWTLNNLQTIGLNMQLVAEAFWTHKVGKEGDPQTRSMRERWVEGLNLLASVATGPGGSGGGWSSMGQFVIHDDWLKGYDTWPSGQTIMNHVRCLANSKAREALVRVVANRWAGAQYNWIGGLLVEMRRDYDKERLERLTAAIQKDVPKYYETGARGARTRTPAEVFTLLLPYVKESRLRNYIEAIVEGRIVPFWGGKPAGDKVLALIKKFVDDRKVLKAPDIDVSVGLCRLRGGEEVVWDDTTYTVGGGPFNILDLKRGTSMREGVETVSKRVEWLRTLLQGAKEDLKDLKEECDPKHGFITPVAAAQVVVFRPVVGRTVYLNTRVRMMEFGVCKSKYCWKGGELGQVLRVVASSTLGLPDVWGWTLEVTEVETILMVVPNKHWDAMVDLWKKDLFVFPHCMEAEGVYMVPGWNGSGRDRCHGDVMYRLPEMKGKYQGKQNPYRLLVGPGENMSEAEDRFSQPRQAFIFSDTLASRETATRGAIEIYVPLEEFPQRMGKLVKALDTYKGVKPEVMGDAAVKHCRNILQILCCYPMHGGIDKNGRTSLAETKMAYRPGRSNPTPIGPLPGRGTYTWQIPVKGAKTDCWWWKRSGPKRMIPVKGVERPGLSSILKRLRSERMLYYGNPVGPFFKELEIRRLGIVKLKKGGTTRRMLKIWGGIASTGVMNQWEEWAIAHKGISGVSSRGILLSARGAKDCEMNGKDLMETLSVKRRELGPRIVEGPSPNKKLEEIEWEHRCKEEIASLEEYRVEEEKEVAADLPPICRQPGCRDRACNPSPQYRNYRPVRPPRFTSVRNTTMTTGIQFDGATMNDVIAVPRGSVVVPEPIRPDEVDVALEALRETMPVEEEDGGMRPDDEE